MKKTLIFLIILLGALAITNPNKEDFTEFAKKRMEQRIDASGDDAVTDFVAKNLPELAEGVVKNLVKRQNYVFCSLYELDMGRKTYKYVGVGTFFVPLQKDRPLR